MFSPSVVFSWQKKKSERVKSSASPARGTETYPTTWVLYRQECICYLWCTDTRKSPPDFPCTFKLHLTCSERLGLQKAAKCTTQNYWVNISHCRLWSPWGWGVKTGKHDNGYTSGALWALQWPLCLLTLPSLSHKSYPERFIRLACQAFPVVFGGWSRSTAKRHGDKFGICWVTTVNGCLCCTLRQCTQ